MTPDELLLAAQEIQRRWPDCHVQYSQIDRLCGYDSEDWTVLWVIDRTGFTVLGGE